MVPSDSWVHGLACVCCVGVHTARTVGMPHPLHALLACHAPCTHCWHATPPARTAGMPRPLHALLACHAPCTHCWYATPPVVQCTVFGMHSFNLNCICCSILPHCPQPPVDGTGLIGAHYSACTRCMLCIVHLVQARLHGCSNMSVTGLWIAVHWVAGRCGTACCCMLVRFIAVNIMHMSVCITTSIYT